MEPLVLMGKMMPYFIACALIAIVLSFFRSPRFKGFAGKMLVHFLIKTRLDKKRYHVLKNGTVQMILSKIESARLTPSRETTRARVNHVKDIVERKNGLSRPTCASPEIVREVKCGSSRGNMRIRRAQSTDCGETAFVLLDDEVADSEVDTEWAFTDSWQERSDRHDDLNATLEHRPFH